MATPQNIHDKLESEPLRCLACQMRADLQFNADDVLMIVCRNQKCEYIEVV